MNYLEMFIVVMTVVLFATTAIVQHQAMASVADQVTNASHTIQSLQLAQEILDEIDARLFAPASTNLTYNKIMSQYNNTTRHYNLDYYGAAFDLAVSVQACDAYGGTTANYKPNLLVIVVVHGPQGQRHDVTLSRVYTQYSVEGL